MALETVNISKELLGLIGAGVAMAILGQVFMFVKVILRWAGDMKKKNEQKRIDDERQVAGNPGPLVSAAPLLTNGQLKFAISEGLKPMQESVNALNVTVQVLTSQFGGFKEACSERRKEIWGAIDVKQRRGKE